MANQRIDGRRAWFRGAFNKGALVGGLALGIAPWLLQAGPVDYSKWSDSERQQAAAVTEVWQAVPTVQTGQTGQTSSMPSDAISLSDLASWQAVDAKGQSPASAPWIAEPNGFRVKPGSGNMQSRAAFCDVQLHLEWRTPPVPLDAKGQPKTGQQRSNSGVFLQSRYEIQILDSYQNETYSNGQAGAIYKQAAPLVNATRAPGQWQSYDIIFQAPRFHNERLTTPATVTVLHNGVLVQNHQALLGNTEWIGAPSYQAHGCAPLQLQDHGDAISFRNIWLRNL